MKIHHIVLLVLVAIFLINALGWLGVGLYLAVMIITDLLVSIDKGVNKTIDTQSKPDTVGAR